MGRGGGAYCWRVVVLTAVVDDVVVEGKQLLAHTELMLTLTDVVVLTVVLTDVKVTVTAGDDVQVSAGVVAFALGVGNPLVPAGVVENAPLRLPSVPEMGVVAFADGVGKPLDTPVPKGVVEFAVVE